MTTSSSSTSKQNTQAPSTSTFSFGGSAAVGSVSKATPLFGSTSSTTPSAAVSPFSAFIASTPDATSSPFSAFSTTTATSSLFNAPSSTASAFTRTSTFSSTPQTNVSASPAATETGSTSATSEATHSASSSASSILTTDSSNTGASTSVDGSQDEAGVGLAGFGNAGNRREMLQLINRLRDTGVQTDIDLPMIAVIGNQSAGKSSLIESISGITLPRSSGTCTRCPTECKLSHSDSPWKCLVKLHFSTDVKGLPIPVKVVPFGGPINSKIHVEDRIRRAQRAILNPSKDPNTFLLQDEISDTSEVSFSKNYVSLEISGPQLTDLSFVDLPGLIASVGRAGDERDIELVKSLVTSYIEKPSCVILLTVACETDFENQGAHHLAKQYDPEGIRTVGVLTKPDRIPQGDEPSWIKILRNETEPLLNHWYCVKQPSTQDVSKGISWEEARRREEEWFSSTKPWSTLEPQYQRFLRTSFLTERLSLILAELIAKRLPKIQEELMSAIDDTYKKLSVLPRAPSSDAVSEVFQHIRSFVRDLDRRVEGTPEENGLLQTIRPHQEGFKIAIRCTAPNFVPWDKKTLKELPKPSFLSEEDPEEDPSKTLFRFSKQIFIEDVQKRAQDARTRELPDNYPFVVQCAYIKQITQQWRGPAMILYENVYMVLKADLEKLVERHFVNMGSNNARRAILMIVNEHLDNAAKRTKERIQWLLDVEGNPTTFNTHYYSDYKEKFLNYYRAARDDSNLVDKLRLTLQKKRSTSNEYETQIHRALSALAELGISVQETDLPKLLPPDPMEPALNIMASVRAYFQVAYKRFTDMVPMAIDHEMVLGIQHGIDKFLQEELKITGPDGQKRCRAMLEQPGTIVMARQELQAKMNRLDAARERLRELM